MKVLNKTISIILSAAFILSGAAVVHAKDEDASADVINIEERVAAAEAHGHRYAYLTVGDGEMAMVNGSVRTNAWTSARGERAGFYLFKSMMHQGKKAALATGAGASASNVFIYLEGKYWQEQPRKRIAVTIEYVDTAKASLDLFYNSDLGMEDTTMIALDTLVTEGSDEWKTVTYYIEDFEKDMFRIRAPSITPLTGLSGQMILGNIFIEEDLSEYPLAINAENGYSGRIFSVGSSQNMTLTYKNTMLSPVTADISYNVRNYEGRIVYSGKLEPVSLAAGEDRSEGILTGVTERGTYTLEVMASVEDRSGSRSVFTRNLKFSIMDTYEEGDERNPLVAFCGGNTDTFYSAGMLGLEQTIRLPISGVRMDMRASSVEPSQGVYTDPLAETRKIYSENGISTCLIAMELQSWYNDGRAVNMYPNTDTAHKGFASFAEYIAKQPDVDTIELFNEWNHSGFSPFDQSADGYLEYCKAAYPVIKAAARDAGREINVLAGGSAGFASNWIRRFIELGGLDYCDGLSYHPYQYKSFDYKTFKQQTDQVASWMMEYHGSLKPISLTELGMPEADDDETTKAGYTHWNKMRSIPAMYIMAQHSAVYEKIYYYCKARTGSRWDQREPGFGLFEYIGNTEGNRLVAFDSAVTLAAYMEKLTGAEPAGKIEKDDFTKFAYEFTKKNGEKIAALWTSKPHDTLGIDLGTDSVKVYDQFGNHIETLKSSDGCYSFELTDELIYIEGDFRSFEETESSITLSDGIISGLEGDLISFSVEDSQKKAVKAELDYDPDIFTFTDSGYLQDGKAAFKAAIKDGITGRYHVEVRLLDEAGNVIYIARPVVDITTEMLDVTIDTAQVSVLDDSRWVVEATLKNISATKDLSGELTVTAPEEFAGSKRRFTELVPGETRLVKIILPQIVVKRPQEMELKLLLNNGIEKSIAKTLDFTTANKAVSKPVIDGKLSFNEWNSTLLAEDRQDKYDVLINGTTWGGVEDLSVSHKIMWDEDNFYMMAKVRDNIHFTEQTDPSSMWLDDGIQFGILANNKETLDSDSAAFTEMCISDNPAGPTVYCHSSAVGKNTGVVEDCEGKISRESGYTIYEMRFPWTELLAADHKAHSGDIYAFSFLVNDNDGGGRKGYMFYNDGIGRTKDPLMFGNLKLN